MKNINTIDQQELNYWYDELEQIRDSGVCNMWGADQELIREHGLEKDVLEYRNLNDVIAEIDVGLSRVVPEYLDGWRDKFGQSQE